MPARASKKIVIVSPVFNDWEAFGELVERLGRLEETGLYDVSAVAIDDYSTERADLASLNARSGHLRDVRVVRLACNMGPMRAVATGLVVASRIDDVQAVIVMDADGEDRPEDIGKLIAAWEQQPSKIVVARRAERSEGRVFKCFYAIYKMIFRMLTGQPLAFGSFSIIPYAALQSLVRNPAVWNNLPAAVVRSRIPYTELKTNRGMRFAGRSRMNFVSLVAHGLSAISVYIDVALLRIIIAMCLFVVVIVFGLLAIFVIKFLTDWAIPGWTSYVAASLTILLLQTLTFTGLVLFQLLSVRSLKTIVPVADVDAFILDSGAENRAAGGGRSVRVSAL
jgi:polyisoprenyl-phosphate glycosyltransferase